MRFINSRLLIFAIVSVVYLASSIAGENAHDNDHAQKPLASWQKEIAPLLDIDNENPPADRLGKAEAIIVEFLKKNPDDIEARLQLARIQGETAPRKAVAIGLALGEEGSRRGYAVAVNAAWNMIIRERKKGNDADQKHTLDLFNKEVGLGYELYKLKRFGSPPPSIGKSTTGKDIRLSDYKGKVVLIDFWATWCGPCIKEMPNIINIYNTYHDQGFEIIGVSLDDDLEKLNTFIKKNNMPWPQYCDGKGWDSEVGRKYEVSSVPFTYLVNSEGNVQAIGLRGENLHAKIKEMMGELKDTGKVSTDKPNPPSADTWQGKIKPFFNLEDKNPPKDRLGKAEKIVKSYLKDNPNDIEARLQLARIQEQTDPSAAVKLGLTLAAEGNVLGLKIASIAMEAIFQDKMASAKAPQGEEQGLVLFHSEMARTKQIRDLSTSGLPPKPIDKKDLDGKMISLADYKGKVVLIDFWATWCGPCIREMPSVIKTYNTYHDKGLEIIGISLDNDIEKCTEFIKKNNMPWRQYCDGKGWNSEVVCAYKVSGIPFTVLIGPKGKIRGMNLRGEQLEARVKKLVEKLPPSK